MFKVFFPVLVLASAVSVFGSPVISGDCSPATLSSYEASFPPPSLGCSIGVLDYSNFTYSALSNAPSDSDILLTPGTDGFDITKVDATPFTANGNVVRFAIYYNIFIDPAPVIVGARNRLDPPVGDVSITEYFCNDSILYPGTTSCFPPTATAASLTVTTDSPDASIIFNPPAAKYETVGIIFTLDGTKSLASFDGLSTATDVQIAPEPASLFLVGLVMLAGGYKLRRQRQN